MTHAQLIAYLKNRAAEHGSQRAYATALGISAVHLGEILQGTRMPGPTVLKALGLKRVIFYEATRTAQRAIAKQLDEIAAQTLRAGSSKELPAWYVDGGGLGWFIVRASNAKIAKSAGVAEWGRGNVNLVRRASNPEVDYFASLKGEIETI